MLQNSIILKVLVLVFLELAFQSLVTKLPSELYLNLKITTVMN